jgi:SET domain-containing protein
MKEDLEKLLNSNDVNGLNRLVATRRLDKETIIAEYKETPPSLYCDKSNTHGYGVFSQTPIRLGQLIETVRIIPLEFRSKYHKDDTIINYCYAFPENSTEEENHGAKLFMFTGLGMMYNHQDTTQCNAKWLWDMEQHMAKLIAIKHIQPNQEITIDYGVGYWNK